MEEFELQYRIESSYDYTVQKANFQLLVIPDSNLGQKVLNLNISCSGNHSMHLSKNIFGFDTIHYYIDKPFYEFWFNLTAKVQKKVLNPFYLRPLTPKDEYEKINSLDFSIDNFMFLSSTSLTLLPSNVDVNFPEYSKEKQVFDFLLELNTFIFHFLEYSDESTNVNTLIEEILQLKKGVCQDYAHLFISVCRKNKIPARYVTGYLNQGADFIGTSQLHAWVEAFVPDVGWVGFDSTNNLLVDHQYIKIAHGTDYNDCSPITGILEYAGIQKSIHSVTVTNQ